MADVSANIHPRKLYELLCACPSAETRAQAAFQFLSRCTGSSHACLFLVRDGELVLVESSPGSAPVPGIGEEAKRAWRSEQEGKTEDDRTKTIDIRMLEDMPELMASRIWQSPNGIAFERSALSLYRAGAWVSVGLFMFKAAELTETTSIRRAHVEALCNALVDAGDVAAEAVAL